MQLQQQIEKLRKAILKLGGRVEHSLASATEAVENRDPELAEAVILRDQQIDQMEIEIEEECLHTLALLQPVAQDLRFVVAVLKVNSDLERIGDLSVNIAELTQLMVRCPEIEALPYDMPGMARIVQRMLNKSLDALVRGDVAMAEEVRRMDDQIDRMYRQAYRLVETRLEAEPRLVKQMIQLLNTSRHLERIADHAVNIADDVIYMARGDIPRHPVRLTGTAG